MTSAGILTVGDELLAGEVENSNATWLADRLTDSGVAVTEIRVVPDEQATIETAVAEFSDRFDHVAVTGGLGSTPDDVTLEAVATALERPLEENTVARADVAETVREIEAEYLEFEFDRERAARFPAGGRPIPNDEGIMPGCAVENVVVLPGIPSEMKAVFERVEGEFSGDVTSRTVVAYAPESNLNPLLVELRERFGVRVGCYPEGERKRIKVSAPGRDRVAWAYEWLRTRPEVRE